MRVTVYRAILLFILVAVVAATCLIFYYRQPAGNLNEVKTVTEEYQFLIKEYDEKIGIFRTGEEKPFSVIGVYVSTLPQVDRMELQAGITVQSEVQLRQLIEDYES